MGELLNSLAPMIDKVATLFAIRENGSCPLCNKMIDIYGDSETKDRIAKEHLDSGCVKHVKS